MSHEFASSNDDASTVLLASSARISFPDDLPLPEFLSAPSDNQLGVNVDEAPVDAFGNLEDLIVEESSSSAAAATVPAGSLTADGADWILNLDLTDETSLIAEANLVDELTAVELTAGELTATELAANDVSQIAVKPDFGKETRVILESKLSDACLGDALGDAGDFLLDAFHATVGEVDFSSLDVAGEEFPDLLVEPALGNHVASQPEVTPQQCHVAIPPPPPALQPMRISLLQLPPGLVLRRCGGSGTQIPSAPVALVAPSAAPVAPSAAPAAPSAAPGAAVAMSQERLTPDEAPLGKRKRDLELSPAASGEFQQQQQQPMQMQMQEQQQQPSKVRRVDPPSPASAVLAADEELDVDSGSEEGVLWEALEQQMKPATSDETPCQCLACQCKSEEDRMFLLTGKRTAKAGAGAAVVGEVKGETVEGAKPMELVLEDGVPLECSIE
ncbi:unnamed protein product [Closterium sp. Naga37s-1]|nr:unnamed protein product [Closterium sp. Naga37s-1]